MIMFFSFPSWARYGRKAFFCSIVGFDSACIELHNDTKSGNLGETPCSDCMIAPTNLMGTPTNGSLGLDLLLVVLTSKHMNGMMPVRVLKENKVFMKGSAI